MKKVLAGLLAAMMLCGALAVVAGAMSEEECYNALSPLFDRLNDWERDVYTSAEYRALWEDETFLERIEAMNDTFDAEADAFIEDAGPETDWAPLYRLYVQRYADMLSLMAEYGVFAPADLLEMIEEMLPGTDSGTEPDPGTDPGTGGTEEPEADKIFDFLAGFLPVGLANVLAWIVKYVLFGWLWGRWL